MEEGEIAQRYGYVDDQGDNRCQSKAELKANRDIGNHQHPGKHNRQNCLLNQLAANRRTNVFYTLNIEVTQLAFQVSHNLLTLLVADDTGTNQYTLSTGYSTVAAFQLDNRITKIALLEHITYLSNGNSLVELQVHDAAAGEVNAHVEALHYHRAQADNQKGNGDSEENFITFNNRELHYLATSCSAFGARAPNMKGLLVMLL